MGSGSGVDSGMGSDPILAIQARTLVRKLRRRMESSDDLRECLMDEYLLLYLVRGERIVFLAIKHHRQLSFDLKSFWQD